MVIDVGASSAEEVVKDFKIRVGAPVVPDVTHPMGKRGSRSGWIGLSLNDKSQ